MDEAITVGDVLKFVLAGGGILILLALLLALLTAIGNAYKH